MNKKVFVIGGSGGLNNWFNDYGFDVTKNPFEADLYQFMGGEDVTPEIYNCLNIHSHNNFERDIHEMGFYALARRLNKPMVGICRGGQFLNVMSGGFMLQHVEGHTDSHEIHCLIKDGLGQEATETIMATSTHHQMMQPSDRGLILAWANIVGNFDPEVVFYEHTSCLCFQPHPEYRRFSELEKYYFELVDDLLST